MNREESLGPSAVFELGEPNMMRMQNILLVKVI